MRALPIFMLLMLAGCMTTPYKAESFSPAKRFAVVSIVTSEEIQAGSQHGASLSGLIKAAASSDSGFSAKADALFQQTAPLVEKTFAGQKAIPLLPPAKVKTNPAYASAKGDEPAHKFAWMTMKLLVAPGYKYFGSEQALADIARQMNLDGVITVNLMFGVAENKVGTLGMAAGTHRALTTVMVSAVGRDGQRLWVEQFKGEAKESMGFFGDAVNFVKMQPMWLESTQAALGELAKKLGK